MVFYKGRFFTRAGDDLSPFQLSGGCIASESPFFKKNVLVDVISVEGQIVRPGRPRSAKGWRAMRGMR